MVHEEGLANVDDNVNAAAMILRRAWLPKMGGAPEVIGVMTSNRI
jgi:hypothetical protein